MQKIQIYCQKIIPFQIMRRMFCLSITTIIKFRKKTKVVGLSNNLYEYHFFSKAQKISTQRRHAKVIDPGAAGARDCEYQQDYRIYAPTDADHSPETAVGVGRASCPVSHDGYHGRMTGFSPTRWRPASQIPIPLDIGK